MQDTKDKQRRLVDLLLRKTRRGEIEWKTTPDDAVFYVSFPDKSIQLSEVPSPVDPEISDYEIALINEVASVAEKFRDTDITSGSREYFERMKELYERARRSALGADKLLDDILTELEEEDF